MAKFDSILMISGRSIFNNCPVNTCKIVQDQNQNADLVIFKTFRGSEIAKKPGQLYMLYLLESPFHTERTMHKDVFNWTASYRRDSDIVAPYEKWVYYDSKVRQLEQNKNYAENKTKKVNKSFEKAKKKHSQVSLKLVLILIMFCLR